MFRLTSSNTSVGFKVAEPLCDSSGDKTDNSFQSNALNLLTTEALERAAIKLKNLKAAAKTESKARNY